MTIKVEMFYISYKYLQRVMSRTVNGLGLMIEFKKPALLIYLVITGKILSKHNHQLLKM